MLTNSLPTNATSSFKTSASLPPPAIFPLSTERRAERRHFKRAGRNQAHPPHRVAANMVHPIVEISPPDSVERRTASWPGITAEIVQATRSDRIESRFCAPVHLLAVYERGMRHEGETFVEGLSARPCETSGESSFSCRPVTSTATGRNRGFGLAWPISISIQPGS